MLTITINPESFGLGFIFGTSVYVVASGAAYITFCAVRGLVSLVRRSFR
jgi:hypothetical protein